MMTAPTELIRSHSPFANTRTNVLNIQKSLFYEMLHSLDIEVRRLFGDKTSELTSHVSTRKYGKEYFLPLEPCIVMTTLFSSDDNARNVSSRALARASLSNGVSMS